MVNQIIVLYVLSLTSLLCESRHLHDVATNDPESFSSTVSAIRDAGSKQSCQMECDGQGRLCESIATNISEKMVCLKNRMQCVSRCANKDLRKTLKKIADKAEKKTIRRLGNSHVYTIEEDIEFFQ
eukprot:TCONS_00001992-protein